MLRFEDGRGDRDRPDDVCLAFERASETIVCGGLQRAGDDPDAITNPVVLVEVLSDSTEASDCGYEFAHYRRLASLREYVLISQAARRIEVFHGRESGEWALTDAGPGEVARLASIGAALPVDEVYFDPLAARG